MLRNIAAYLSISFAALRTEHRLPRLEMLEHTFKVLNIASLSRPGNQSFHDIIHIANQNSTYKCFRGSSNTQSDALDTRTTLPKAGRDVDTSADRAVGVGVRGLGE